MYLRRRKSDIFFPVGVCWRLAAGVPYAVDVIFVNRSDADQMF